MCLCESSSSSGPHPNRTPQQPNTGNQATVKEKINTDLCFVGTVRCVCIIDCKQRRGLHSCPTRRQSVSQSAESGTPRTRSRDSCNRADSCPNNASFTQTPCGKRDQQTLGPNLAFLYVPRASFSGAGVVLLRSVCQALAPAIRQQRWAR